MRLPILNGNIGMGTGLFLGAAAVLLAPVVFPVVAGVAKSLTKAGMKGGLIMFERGKVAAAEAKEMMEDLAAEAKAELAQEQGSPAPAKKKKAAAASAS